MNLQANTAIRINIVELEQHFLNKIKLYLIVFSDILDLYAKNASVDLKVILVHTLKFLIKS